MSSSLIHMCTVSLTKILTMTRRSRRIEENREARTWPWRSNIEVSERRVLDEGQLYEEKSGRARRHLEALRKLSHWGPLGWAPPTAPLANLVVCRSGDFPPSTSACMLPLYDSSKGPETFSSLQITLWQNPTLSVIHDAHHFVLQWKERITGEWEW